MAGTHQIWRLDFEVNTMTCLSGSGAEGNSNLSATDSTWAQPSGLSCGLFNNEPFIFVADSESSAVRGFY
jgi:hypothetical protein